ncbi:hypothetical protein DB346_16465 [Verrucomicrobia bacterium LW23]|nr:hypothetical protein DB346_16465 [Verrucomicrobia bacterium LW23]
MKFPCFRSLIPGDCCRPATRILSALLLGAIASAAVLPAGVALAAEPASGGGEGGEGKGAAAADPFDDPLIQQVQQRHDKGVQGDKEAVISLVKDLEKWTKEKPNNYLLLAYLGSAYTMRSRDVFPGPSKLDFLKNGVKTMDAAVAAAPRDVAVRFIRGVNNYELPAFCNRRDSARSDFKILLTQVVGEGAPKLNTQTVQAIHYYAGLAYLQTKQKDDAKIIWQKGVALAPNSALAGKMQSQLAKLKS